MRKGSCLSAEFCSSSYWVHHSGTHPAMAQSTIRKAIGTVKDQTSISIAKVSGNIAPELEVLVVKATSHDDNPADDKYIREIINLSLLSSGYVSACLVTISKRLTKTHDWIVALKSLIVVHRVLIDGHLSFGEEIAHAKRTGTQVLNLSDFRDEAHSNSWEHSCFVRFYALYLDETIETIVLEKKLRGGFNGGNADHGDEFNSVRQRRQTPWRSLQPDRVLVELNKFLRVIDRVLACKPAGLAKSSRLVISAFYLVVKESFELYIEVCEALGFLLDQFKEMEYDYCIRAFDVCVNAAEKIDELARVFAWSKDMGIARSSEYPEIQIITQNLLGTLQNYLKEMTIRPNHFYEIRDKEEKLPQIPIKNPEPVLNEIKPLPIQSIAQTKLKDNTHQPTQGELARGGSEDLVNLREEGVTVYEEGNKLALALFCGPERIRTDGSWETFSSNEAPEVTSAWKTPAAEAGKADWEVALVESATYLSNQKADMGGGFDSLLLNGMYDQGAIRQHVKAEKLNSGSVSSVAITVQGKSKTQVLALPAPDGTIEPVGHQDPFAASLMVPPPSYVQMAEMEKKQQLLIQEQLLWQQYGREGMSGQVGLTKIAGGSAFGMNPQSFMPQVGGMGQVGSYYYAPF